VLKSSYAKTQLFDLVAEFFHQAVAVQNIQGHYYVYRIYHMGGVCCRIYRFILEVYAMRIPAGICSGHNLGNHQLYKLSKEIQSIFRRE